MTKKMEFIVSDFVKSFGLFPTQQSRTASLKRLESRLLPAAKHYCFNKCMFVQIQTIVTEEDIQQF